MLKLSQTSREGQAAAKENCGIKPAEKLSALQATYLGMRTLLIVSKQWDANLHNGASIALRKGKGGLPASRAGRRRLTCESAPHIELLNPLLERRMRAQKLSNAGGRAVQGA